MRWLTLLLAFTLIAFGADRRPQTTRRVVNGKTVDLKPIFEWEELQRALGANNPKLPPRPMPHWERINANVFEVGEPVILVHNKNFIVVKNLPAVNHMKRAWQKGQSVYCYAFKTGLTNYVTKDKIAAPVYDHGRETE